MNAKVNIGRAYRLGVPEVQDGQEEGVQRGEEQVSSPANRVDQDGRDHDDEEVPDPVGHGRGGVGLRAGLERVDLGRVQPGERQPSGTEECDVGEETDTSTLGSRGRVGNQSAKDKDHGQALANGSDEEELSAAQALDGVPGSAGKEGIDNHVDTTEEQSQILRSSDRGLEENGEVVDDGVATRQLLHHLGTSTEQETAQVLSLAVGPQLLHGSVSALHTSSPDGVVDDNDLGLDLLVLTVLVSERGKNRVGFVDTSVGEEPSRRLGESQHQDENDQGESDLESDGESPDKGVGSVGAAIVDPVGNQCTNGNVTTLDANELASVVRS